MTDNKLKPLDGSTYSPEKIAKMTVFFARIDERIVALRREAQESFAIFNAGIRDFYTRTTQLVIEVSELAGCLDANETELSGPVQHSLQRISSLVTDLQYHDIIRQKLEHIQQTNEKIVSAMEQAVSHHGTQSMQEWQPILPDVVQLQAALLDYTDTEYQRAFRKMKASFESFRENTRSVGEIGTMMLEWLPAEESESAKAALLVKSVNELVQQIDALLSVINEPGVFSHLVKEICSQLKEFALELPLSDGCCQEQSWEVLKHLQQLYTMQSERLIYQRIMRSREEVKNIVSSDEGEVELF